jgi:radical SAM superfamily enzyme YgiQ (UPF0313 family)
MTAGGGNILLVYPQFPSTYWGMQFVLPVLGRKAYMPPLGLITLAAMLPAEFSVRLIDLNCEPLTDEAVAWADMVFLSAMLTQQNSLFEVARRCRAAGKPIVMGGPYPTGSPDECAASCDTIVQGEAEAVWDEFLADLRAGQLRPRYASEDKPDVTRTPVPRFDLLNVNHYLTIPIQFSRGCPFQCEFCDIIVMFGRRPRTKSPEQVIAELEAVRRTGYRGEVFIVDDNFIGNKKEVRRLLPVLRAWNDSTGHVFDFGTEASIDLAADPALMAGMVESGFRWVFLGIETPSLESLKETLKFQNLREPLEESVARILAAGLHVSAGFIIGFDSDGEDIFDRQIAFIDRAAIPFAMVGLLVALAGTPLYHRMRTTGRLRESSAEMSVDQCGYTNIETVLPRRAVLEGYRRVMQTLYSPERYFERSLRSLERMKPPATRRAGRAAFRNGVRRNLAFVTGRSQSASGMVRRSLAATVRSVKLVASLPRDFRRAALRFTWRALRARPDQFAGVMELVVFGYHLHRFTLAHVLPQVDAQLAAISADRPSVIPPTPAISVG